MALLSFLAAGLPAPARASDDSSPGPSADQARSYALIVANNESVDPGVESLEYADDDGARYWEMFSSLTDRAELLTTLDADSQRIFDNVVDETVPPTRERLERTVESLSRAIERDRAKGRKTEVYLVFTGHGNVDETGEGYLSLADSKLRRSELYREVIRPLDADYTHLIVDACHAYYMVNSRGGNDGAGANGDWQDDRSGERLDKQLSAYLTERDRSAKKFRRTVGVIVSTAGAAEVHEWSRFRGGVFSHELRSGLLGAADANGDGEVTYPEIEAYLVAANAAVTNPKARINVHARAPSQQRSRPVTSLGEFENATILRIPDGIGGRYHVEDARGLRYADFHVDGATATQLALLQKPVASTSKAGYYLRKDDQQASVPITSGRVSSTELAFAETTQSARGSVEEAYRSDLYKTPFGPTFVVGFDAGRRSARPAPSGNDEAGEWRPETAVAYGMAPSMNLEGSAFRQTRPQHQMAVGLTFRHRSGWGVGPFANYGLSLHDGRAIHRTAVGVEGSYRLQLTPWFDLTPRLRAGHQVVLASGGAQGLTSDPLGLRVAGAVGAGFRLSPAVSAYLEGGVAGDLHTVDYDGQPNEERFTPSPFGRIGLRF